MTNTLGHILGLIYQLKDDALKLEKIYQFMQDEILEKEEAPVSLLPERYEELIASIAETIECGSLVYLNVDTLERECVCEDEDLSEEELGTGTQVDGSGHQFETWENVLCIAPLSRQQSFDIMRAYTDKLEVSVLQIKLDNALKHRKPFANFKRHVEGSNHRKDWFAFKQASIMAYVREQMLAHMALDHV